MGPTIQQGVIQHPVQWGTQSTTTGARPKETVRPINTQQTRTPPSENHNSGMLHQIQEKMEETGCQNVMKNQSMATMY